MYVCMYIYIYTYQGFKQPTFHDFAHIPRGGTPDFPQTPAKKEVPKQKLLVKGQVYLPDI